MKIGSDIDIDFGNVAAARAAIPWVPAISITRDERVRHPSGNYLQDIPIDPIDGMAAYTTDDAANLGYFKIDLLSNTIYSGIRDEAHLFSLMREPPWEMFLEPLMVGHLAQIKNHFGLVQSFAPKSIPELAIVLALIRPSKRYLIGRTRAEIEEHIWVREDDSKGQFKHSHAIAYAMSIVVQMNLILENLAAGLSISGASKESNLTTSHSSSH